jgi:hypothetical protein
MKHKYTQAFDTIKVPSSGEMEKETLKNIRKVTQPKERRRAAFGTNRYREKNRETHSKYTTITIQRSGNAFSDNQCHAD